MLNQKVFNNLNRFIESILRIFHQRYIETNNVALQTDFV